METKKCSKCKNCKLPDEFSKNKSRKDGRNSWCKECFNNYNRGTDYKRRREYLVKWHQELRKTERNKSYEKKYRNEYHSTFDGVVGRLLSAARRRARENNFLIDIDRKWIEERLHTLKCEATGVDLVLERDKSVQHTPFKPSIDRIDNNKGYTKGNCRIVAVIYNKAKSDGLDEDVIKMSCALVKKLGLLETEKCMSLLMEH